MVNITIIGTGYVGLVSGTCFAELNHNVICVDKIEEKIANLKKGEIPIYEPGLSELVQKNYEKERLKFTTNLKDAAKDAEAIFIAVGTPEDEEGRADLKYIYAVAEELAESAKNDVVLITKSTVPVGTNEKISEFIKSKNPKLKFSVASNPEFLREGSAIKDFLNPDRVVIGTDNEQAEFKLRQIYAPLTDSGVPLVATEIPTAELIKYASNAFLATKIGFINEIADICELVGANVEDVSYGMGLDNRIGPKNLKAGPGFGGSCFPKDTLALCAIAKDAGVPTQVVEAVIDSNDDRKHRMAEKVEKALGGNIIGKKLALLGLAFKANTDDIRHSPALKIAELLLQKDAILQCYDPEATENSKRELEESLGEKHKNAIYAENVENALSGAEAAIIVTEWGEFKSLDLDKAKHLMKGDILIDLRNLFNEKKAAKAGLKYISVGR